MQGQWWWVGNFNVLILHKVGQVAANQSQYRPTEQQLRSGHFLLADMWLLEKRWRGRHSSGTELTQLCTNTVTAPGVLVHHLPSRVWALLPAQPGSASGYTGIVNMVVVVAISLVTSGYSAVSRYPHLGAVHI